MCPDISGIEYISFDLDGTLVSHDFSTVVWRDAIPRLVAAQRGIDMEEAKQWVYERYEEVGEEALEWYDLGFWFRRFGLKNDWRKVLRDHRHLIRTYPEIPGVLEDLSRRYRLIILSNASRPFIHEELLSSEIGRYFERVISATSDLAMVKKTPEFYLEICRTMKTRPDRMIHVGDHWEFDFVAPKQAGLLAFFLDRSHRHDGPCTVRDLEEFTRRILR
jgi:putative hydrolase of the HAD superfamily